MKCTSCGGEVIYDDSLQAYVCTSCGLVVDDRAIVADYPRPGHESRYSAGFTYRIHDHGVGGTLVSGDLKRHVREGRTWAVKQLDIVSREERVLARTLKHLNSIAEALGLPSAVVETAGRMILEYVKTRASSIGVYRETRARGIAAAALYLALKIHGYPMFLAEVSRAAGFNPWKMSEYVKELRGLGVKPGPNQQVAGFVHKVASAVNAPADIEPLAITILTTASQTGLTSGHSPVSLAAGAIYLSSILLNKRIPQQRFKEIASVNSFRKIIDLVDIEVFL